MNVVKLRIKRKLQPQRKPFLLLDWERGTLERKDQEILSMGILWKRLCYFSYCIVATTVNRTILRLWTLDMEKYG